VSAEEDIARAEEAERVLNSKILKDAFAAAEERICNLWKATEPPEAQAREEYYQQINGIRLLRRALTTYVGRGKFAEKSLALKEEREGGPGSSDARTEH
jgi:hypothetical protein